MLKELVMINQLNSPYHQQLFVSNRAGEKEVSEAAASEAQTAKEDRNGAPVGSHATDTSTKEVKEYSDARNRVNVTGA